MELEQLNDEENASSGVNADDMPAETVEQTENETVNEPVNEPDAPAENAGGPAGAQEQSVPLQGQTPYAPYGYAPQGWQTYGQYGYGQYGYPQAGQYAQRQTPAQPEKKKRNGWKIALAVIAGVLALTLFVSVFVAGAVALLKMRNSGYGGDPTPIESTVETPTGNKTTDNSQAVPTHYNQDDWVNPGKLDDENAIVNVAAKCSPSVVTVRITLSSGSGSGSGVIWSSNGYVVTNNHVVEDAQTVTVVLENGDKHSATVLATDPENDLALLRINVTGLLPVSVGSSEDVKVGQTAVVIGNPLGTLANSVTSGIISALARDISVEGTKLHVMQTTAAVNQGNSGGGCFDINGNLIGIVNAKTMATGVEGLGFCIPVDTVKSVISEMIEEDDTTLRKSFGVTKAYEVTESNYAEFRSEYTLFRRIEELNGEPLYGVYIVSDGMVSYVNEENTFVNGDVIRTVNGKEIRTFKDLDAALEDANVGDVLTVEVTRLVTKTSGFKQTRVLENYTIEIKVIEMYR